MLCQCIKKRLEEYIPKCLFLTSLLYLILCPPQHTTFQSLWPPFSFPPSFFLFPTLCSVREVLSRLLWVFPSPPQVLLSSHLRKPFLYIFSDVVLLSKTLPYILSSHILLPWKVDASLFTYVLSLPLKQLPQKQQPSLCHSPLMPRD